MILDNTITLINRSRVVVLSALWLCVFPTDAQPKRVFIHERDVQTSSTLHNGSIPRWDGKMLVGYEKNHTAGPIVFTVDRDGRRDETLFTIPDAGLINLSDIAASPDGQIAVVGGAYTNDGRGATFLARIELDRKRQVVTRVWPYCAVVVTFAPDGTTWTIGHLKDQENTRVITNHVLRRFDPSGTMLSSTPVRENGWRTDEISLLRASRDRVGWYTRENEYIEFALDGSEMARYDGPPGADTFLVQGLALSENNDVVMGVWSKDKTKYGLVILDRETRTWSPLSEQYAKTTWGLFGFDGTTLVTDRGDGAMRRYKIK